MAVRGLCVRRCYSLGLDGDLQLPGESLCVAFAYTHSDSNGNANGDGISNANSNGQTYSNSETGSHTSAASHTGSPAVSLAAYLQISSGTREAIREFPKSCEFFISKLKQEIKLERVDHAAASPLSIFEGARL